MVKHRSRPVPCRDKNILRNCEPPLRRCLPRHPPANTGRCARTGSSWWPNTLDNVGPHACEHRVLRPGSPPWCLAGDRPAAAAHDTGAGEPQVSPLNAHQRCRLQSVAQVCGGQCHCSEGGCGADAHTSGPRGRVATATPLLTLPTVDLPAPVGDSWTPVALPAGAIKGRGSARGSHQGTRRLPPRAFSAWAKTRGCGSEPPSRS